MDISVLDILNDLDQKLLLFLNSKHSPFWDEVMIKATDRFFWIPFYVLIAIFLIWKFKKRTWLLLAIIPLMMIMADQLSASVMKPLFERLRPCHDPSIKELLRTINGCGGMYGFVSSHATNTFALSTFMVLLFRNSYKFIGIIYIWAIGVSYSRIYLGVHFPGDILGGAVLGMLIAFLFYKIYVRLEGSIFKNKIV
jgi:undecaprenyl-diphosphatase